MTNPTALFPAKVKEGDTVTYTDRVGKYVRKGRRLRGFVVEATPLLARINIGDVITGWLPVSAMRVER